MKFFDFLNSLGTTPTVQPIISEGIQDTHILKAIFLQGVSSGSGKDFVLDQILEDKGLIEIPTVKVADYLFGRNRINFDDELTNLKTKNSNELRDKLAFIGRNGIIINGTADPLDKIAKIKNVLENLGYDSLMILVNVSSDVAQQRNIERAKKGGRAIPDTQLMKSWNLVQQNRPQFAKMFGQMYLEFDNSIDLRNADPQSAMQKHQELDQLNEQVQEFLSAEPQSEIGQMWMQDQLAQENDEEIDDSGVNQLPKTGEATEQADKLGLQYYGSGRYGKNKTITHRSVNGKLKDIPKVNEMLDEPNKINSLFSSLFSKNELKPKLSLNEIRQNLVKESINDGEAGMPMNGYSAEVIDKDSGKATSKTSKRIKPVTEGRTGIDLKTFRAKVSHND